MSYPFRELLLLLGDDEALCAADGEGCGRGRRWVWSRGQRAASVGRGIGGRRAAASVAVALSKLLWRCQGRLVDGLRGLEGGCDVRCHEEGAVVAPYGLRCVLARGARMGRTVRVHGPAVYVVPPGRPTVSSA